MNVNVMVVVVGCCGAELRHNRGPCWALRPGALPEGTARLEEPLAGQQLNKRWEGSVSLEGHSRWEAPHLSAEDKQMLNKTGKTRKESVGISEEKQLNHKRDMEIYIYIYIVLFSHFASIELSELFPVPVWTNFLRRLNMTEAC